MVQICLNPLGMKLPESEYEVRNELVRKEIAKRHNHEVTMINDILCVVLNREPTTEDFKKIEKIHPEHDPTSYVLYFNKKSLGRVRFKPHPIEITPKEIKPEFWSLEFFPEDYTAVNSINRYIG